MSQHAAPEHGTGVNLLLLSTGPDRAATRDCLSHLSNGDAVLDVVHITYTRSVADVMDSWADSDFETPGHLHVVRVQERMVAGGDDAVPDADGVTVSVANPNDLTGLAMRLQDVINTIERSDREAAVCFESVTALLQYTDDQSAFKFLHMLTGQLRDVDARAHFHLNPEAYGDQVVGRMQSVFDDAVSLDEAVGDD